MDRRVLIRSLAGAAAATAVPGWAGGGVSAPVPAHGIFLNQLGYRPGTAKRASVTVTAGAAGPAPFLVRSAVSRQVVFKGELAAPVQDAASGDLVREADFSGLHTPGSYWLEVPGGRGDTFRIAEDAYADALRVTMRGFHGQRCGCAVDLGGGYRHAACHAAGGFHASSGRQGALKNGGGWHDAGDYGRYVVNSGITTGTLLWAWEMFPEVLQHLRMGIPESGGRMPDFLAEVRWNLQWMLQMQDEDGGVWHKQTSEHFCAFIAPEADTLPSVVIGTGAAPYKSTCATADLAAVAAIASRCYRPFDAAFADICLAAARRAYTWASARPSVVFRNPAGVATGEYGDPHCDDELLWAAAELFRTTGEAVFEAALLAAVEPKLHSLKITTPSWGGVAAMGLWSYCMTPRGRSDAVKQAVVAATVAAAQQRAQRSDVSGYRNTLAERDYTWGSNSVAGNDGLLLVVADRLQPHAVYMEAALGNLHYLFGRNCFGVSWVTGLGVRPFQHPHHRPSAADGIAAPWPGLLSGGPNAHGGDAVANAMPKAPPMRMWLDDQGAYSMNEIAINWNAPLVFLLAAANSRRAVAARLA